MPSIIEFISFFLWLWIENTAFHTFS
jgi:hypothetical protein